MLTISDLNKTYADGTQALRHINLSIPKGITGLLGPNGAGKSTLMRSIACLQAPDSGDIHLDNMSVLHEPNYMRQRLGYLPQDFGVYANMSCLNLLDHIGILKGLTNKSTRRAQIRNLLELTNLTAVANKAVSDFSGGMRQRFGIAQALLGNPEVLILDEPTAGLDPQERERLHEVLVNISSKKRLLLCTHIVEDVENLCTQAAILLNGEIVECAAIATLIAPLQGRVWEVESTPRPSDLVLSTGFRFGKHRSRIYSINQPSPNAVPLPANLQDRYFLELTTRNKQHAAA